MAESAFNKTQFNSSPQASSKTNPRQAAPEGARSGVPSGKVRGVEHPIAEDAALIGDTRHELHTKSLPRTFGPNYGLGNGKAPGEQLRVDCGEGMSGESY